MALKCAQAAHAKKGDNIVVLDLSGVSEIADFFVIASGASDKQLRAMAEEIGLQTKKDLGESVFRVEGLREGQWVVMDYIDVVVHLFLAQSRSYFNLDRLWGDAKVIKKI